jgi:hypothetical protein
MKKAKLRRCKFCKRRFTPKRRPKQDFCSLSCRSRGARPAKHLFVKRGLVTELRLSGGLISLVDTEDVPFLKQFKWFPLKTKNNTYVRTNSTFGGHRLHRLLLGLPASDVDHRNGNGLDNRRENLRAATESQNAANSKKPKSRSKTSSQYKGVSWHRINWQASIRFRGKAHHLGTFSDEADAAKAYDRAALKYFGEFARLNFPAVEN